MSLSLFSSTETEILGLNDIAEAALNALTWSYQVPKGIKVSVSDGCVKLSGETEWEFQKVAAQDAVRVLMGVKDVISEITIRSKVKPEDIKTRIEAAFKRSAESEGKKIAVFVDGDRVTLSGSVHSLNEKDDARWAAYFAPGVTSVSNNLVVSN